MQADLATEETDLSGGRVRVVPGDQSRHHRLRTGRLQKQQDTGMRPVIIRIEARNALVSVFLATAI